jgi:hypothetical protein
MRPVSPRPSLEKILGKAARHGSEENEKKEAAKKGKEEKNGDKEKDDKDAKKGENGDDGEDEGKTICKQSFKFSIPGGPNAKCGVVKGEVEREIKVKCPPPPEKPGLCPGDYPNGNGNGNGKGEEKEEESKEEEGGGPDRVWDSVQGG